MISTTPSPYNTLRNETKTNNREGTVLAKLFRNLRHHVGNLARNSRLAYLRRMGVDIGENCMLSVGAKVDVRRGKVIIGDNCTITYGSIILSHDRSAMHIDPSRSGEATTTLEDNVYIGVNAVVLPGVTIGANSVIGAGAIVTKDVPAGVVAVGNPAKVVKKIERFHTEA